MQFLTRHVVFCVPPLHISETQYTYSQGQQVYFRRFHASVGDIVTFFDKTFWDMRSPPAPPSTYGRNAVHIFPAGVFQAVPCICRRPDAGEARSDFPQWRSVPSGSRLKVPCCAHNCARKHATARNCARFSQMPLLLILWRCGLRWHTQV